MSNPTRARLTAAALLCGLSFSAQGASVYLTPVTSTANLGAGTATLELFADFTGTPTVGGGIDLALSGPLSLVSFTPSSFFNGLNTDPTGDSDFTGFGAANADAAFEIHFGSFAGVSGVNKLGDLTIGLNGLGLGTLGLAINSFYGPFFSTGGPQLDVTLTGASIQVVPVPAAAWLLLSGVGVLAGVRRRAVAA